MLSHYLAFSIEQMCNIQFTKDKKEDGISYYVYHQGRKELVLELLNHDATQAAKAQEKANENSTIES